MLRILHTNDFHGGLTEAKAARLRALREECDLYFDCGDAIKSGNLAIPLHPDPVWTALDELKCTASVLGNRETHINAAAFARKIEGAQHPILCANLRMKSGERPLPGSLVLEATGLRVGIVGVMVPMVTERMATRAASAFLWDPPAPSACALAHELRPEVNCLIALTHIGLRQDRELAESCPLFDLVLGGHSHDAVTETAGAVFIAQAGSHGRFAGRYDWTPDKGVVHAELIRLD